MKEYVLVPSRKLSELKRLATLPSGVNPEVDHSDTETEAKVDMENIGEKTALDDSSVKGEVSTGDPVAPTPGDVQSGSDSADDGTILPKPVPADVSATPVTDPDGSKSDSDANPAPDSKLDASKPGVDSVVVRESVEGKRPAKENIGQIQVAVFA